MIRNIVFDMGGVLIRFDRHLFISRFDVSDEDEKLLLREVFLSLEWVSMDRGSMDEEDAAQKICARLPEHLHDIARKLVYMWDRPILPIEGMEELVRELKAAGYHIFLLSNASRRQHDYWPAVPCSDCFEDTFISADYGVVKPQPEIYRQACEKFNILPQESIFIDDMPANVEGAVYSGMDGCVFHQDAQELRRLLRQRGICVSE